MFQLAFTEHTHERVVRYQAAEEEPEYVMNIRNSNFTEVNMTYM